MPGPMPLVVCWTRRRPNGAWEAGAACPCCGFHLTHESWTRRHLGQELGPCPACLGAGRVREDDGPITLEGGRLVRCRVEVGHMVLGMRTPVWAMDPDGTVTVYHPTRN